MRTRPRLSDVSREVRGEARSATPARKSEMRTRPRLSDVSREVRGEARSATPARKSEIERVHD